MHDSRLRGLHRYRLVPVGDYAGPETWVEFEAVGAEAALIVLQKLCDGCEMELFEDGRSLARLRKETSGGFWVLTGTPNAPVRPVKARAAAVKSVPPRDRSHRTEQKITEAVKSA